MNGGQIVTVDINLFNNCFINRGMRYLEKQI